MEDIFSLFHSRQDSMYLGNMGELNSWINIKKEQQLLRWSVNINTAITKFILKSGIVIFWSIAKKIGFIFLWRTTKYKLQFICERQCSPMVPWIIVSACIFMRVNAMRSWWYIFGDYSVLTLEEKVKKIFSIKKMMALIISWEKYNQGYEFWLQQFFVSDALSVGF